MFVVLGSSAYLATAGRKTMQLPFWFYTTAALATLIIFTKTGADYNHLIDLHVASVCILVTWISLEEGRSRFPVYALIIAGGISLAPIAQDILKAAKLPRINVTGFVHQLTQMAQGPILAENPMIPLLAGQRPYIVDPAHCRVVRHANPGVYAPLLNKLSDRYFVFVVLESDPRTESGREFLRKYHIGSGFVEALEENYDFVKKVGRQVLYMPLTK
jgi:hypothetical protein